MCRLEQSVLFFVHFSRLHKRPLLTGIRGPLKTEHRQLQLAQLVTLLVVGHDGRSLPVAGLARCVLLIIPVVGPHVESLPVVGLARCAMLIIGLAR